MARIRTIKPEFPQSESMGRVSREARYCFMLLWTIADDSGRLRGNSRMLASLLYPYDDDATGLIDGWLVELSNEGCIDRYAVDGNTYIQVAKWLKHQRIDKPTTSKIPEFNESSRILANPRESSQTEVEVEVEVDLGSGMDQEVEGKKTLPPSAPKFSAKQALIDLGVTEQVANDYLAIRKAKKSPLTETAIVGIQREAAKAKITFADAVGVSTENGWQGFKADWYQNLNPSTGMQNREAIKQAGYAAIFTPAIKRELTGQKDERPIN